MARRKGRKKRRSSPKNNNSRKIYRASKNKGLSDKEVIKEIEKYMLKEDVDPIDIRSSWDKFSEKYDIRNDDE